MTRLMSQKNTSQRVIPAKARIHFGLFLKPNMDSRFRGNDTLEK